MIPDGPLRMARLGSSPARMEHAGWPIDAYPDLPMLDAGTEMLVAEIQGPAVINTIHVSRALDPPLPFEARPGLTVDEQRALGARGVVLEITFNNATRPSVAVPLADFFGDGAGGACPLFSSLFVEKAPGSYNARFPMPFESSARVTLRNETDVDLFNYTAVEWKPLAGWEEELGYFHATWTRRAFQLDAQSKENIVRLNGPGKLIGQAWTVSTDDTFFDKMAFVMEGNNRLEIDGELAIEYLGTEDAFGFAWGFQEPFVGLYAGLPIVSNSNPAQFVAYRFRDLDDIPFESSFELAIDWTHEFRSALFQERVAPLRPDRQWLPDSRSEGRGWIDYATTTFWYASVPGHDHDQLPPLGDRIRSVLRENPPRDG